MTKNFQKLKPLIYYGLTALILITALAAFGLLIKIGLYPYQHEVREAAPLAIISLMLKGLNPYSFEALPAYTYVYGILYPLFTLPLSFLFGIDIIQLRIVNIIFCLASVYLMLSIIPKKEQELSHYLWASVLLIGLLQKNIYGRPEAVGLFFMLASVLIPYKMEYSKKSLILGALFGILGFYAKPYFIIGIGCTAASLFLFVSKKTSLLYFSASMAAWSLSLFIMHLIFPAYLTVSLFHHIAMATYNKIHMLGQMQYFWRKELILLLSFIFLGIVSFTKTEKKEGFPNLSMDKPLLSLDYKLYLFDFLIPISFLFFILKLGGHLGAGGALYLYDLAYPFIFLAVLTKIRPKDLKYWQKILLTLPCLLIILSYPRPIYHLVKQQKQYRLAIQKIEALIEPSKNILSSADLTSIMLKKNMPINDSGQSEYYITGNIPIAQKIYGTTIKDTDRKYKEQVHQNIQEKQYDYVFISWVNRYLIPKDFTNYYKLETVYDYPGIWDGGKTELWTPKADS